MPPKKTKDTGPSAKTLNKEKVKLVEDKTFGLKNKNKSKAVQKYVAGVTNQVMAAGQQKGGISAQVSAQFLDKAEKKKKAEQNSLIASLFKSVVTIQQTADGEIDYKKTVCAYFKAGVCEKGKKCRYSHDLSLEDQKASNIDIYQDPRAKLGTMPDTIITCRDFIEAVEQSKYGFNWECPHGGDACPYRHMLPQGYVLSRDKGPKKAGEESEEEELTLEEQIEEQRAALPADGLTPVTKANFEAWKVAKAKRKQDELEAKIAAEEAKGKKDKGQMRFMSGKALFTYNPELFEDAEGAIDEEQYESDYSDGGGEAGENGVEEKKVNGKMSDPDDIHDQEERKEEVKVDKNLFQDEGGDENEEVDFDDDDEP